MSTSNLLIHPITGKTQHRVCGRDGKLLNKLQLANELPKFIHAELVDIPFYDDSMQGHNTALITPEARAKTQVSMVADFIKDQSNLSLLRSLWARVSSFTNYQATLCDFDWGEERLSVSLTPLGFSTGSPVGLIQAINHFPYFTRGVQHCFRFDSLALLTLMHKQSYSVFGRIDFSVLRSLLISLGSSLGEPWMLKSPCLTSVSCLCIYQMGEGFI